MRVAGVLIFRTYLTPRVPRRRIAHGLWDVTNKVRHPWIKVRQTVDLVWLPLHRILGISSVVTASVSCIIVVVVLHDRHEWWTVLASVAVKQ